MTRRRKYDYVAFQVRANIKQSPSWLKVAKVNSGCVSIYHTIAQFDIYKCQNLSNKFAQQNHADSHFSIQRYGYRIRLFFQLYQNGFISPKCNGDISFTSHGCCRWRRPQKRQEVVAGSVFKLFKILNLLAY